MRKYFRRLIKYPALFCLLVVGLLVAVGTYFTAGVSRKRIIAQYWFQILLIILNVELEIKGLNKQAKEYFIVANHISWMDIPVISACLPVCFLSKSEVRQWPLIGFLARYVETIFIARASRRAIKSVNQDIEGSLLNRQAVCVFPEGTTTPGDRLGAFHSSIFQPAVKNGSKVLPVAIRYLDETGEPTIAPAYIGSMTLMSSLDRIITEPMLCAEVNFLKPIDSRGSEREHISEVSREMIFTALFK
jgi:1-acyl-sn-glycerol-3-phosphate acyltransferase